MISRAAASVEYSNGENGNFSFSTSPFSRDRLMNQIREEKKILREAKQENRSWIHGT